MKTVLLIAVITMLVSISSSWAADSPEVSLESQYLRLGFSGTTGQLNAFVDRSSGDNYVKAADSVKLRDVVTIIVGDHDGKGQVEALPKDVVVASAGNQVTIRINEFASSGKTFAISAQLSVRLSDASAESRWNIRIENHDPTQTVFRVTFPRIQGIRLGDRWEDDSLYFPFWGGERFPNAVSDFKAINDRSLQPLEIGIPRVHLNKGMYVHEASYAGGASMPWMDYVDAKHGLYFASYDPEFRVTQLLAETEGPSSGFMNLEFTKWVSIGPGKDWTSADFVVASHSGDWHWAAEQYRNWFNTQVTLTFGDEAWRERIGGWLVFMKNAYGQKKYSFADLPALWNREKQAGMDLLIPFGWSVGGFDAFDPEYFPDLDLGDPMAIARAYRQIRQDGGHVMTYINARIFNTRSIYFKTLGEQWAARNVDGSLRTETYKPGSPETFAVMCPGNPGWRNLLSGFAEAAVSRYGADLVYYDQVASAGVNECYGTEEDFGLWNQHYLQLLKQASDATHAYNPHTAFMIEGAGDIYTQYSMFQSYLAYFISGTRFAYPELYRYTFPEAILASIVQPTRVSPNSLYPVFPAIPREIGEPWLCRDIMNGNLVAFMDDLLDDHPWWEEVQHLLALRRAAAPWMGRGVFRDTVDVMRADPELQVKTFQIDEPSRRATLVEVYDPEKTQKHTIVVRNNSSSGRGYLLAADGSKTDLPVTFRGGEASFELPPALLSMVVIENPAP